MGTSIVVVTHNHLHFTRLCLESVLANSSSRSLEVIVVDNGSEDGTPDYLDELAAITSQISPILNRENEGFARANNRGLGASTGEVLILLNNDTIVPPGWDDRLAAHLDDPRVGLVGPLTNRTCNEAQVETDYATYGGLVEFADRISRAAPGVRFDMGMLAMFCLAMRRDVFERRPARRALRARHVRGRRLLEEGQGRRLSRRLRPRRVRPPLRPGLFRLAGAGRIWPRLGIADRAFEEKWGTPWVAHSQRTAEYLALLERIRAAAREGIAGGGDRGGRRRGGRRPARYSAIGRAATSPATMGITSAIIRPMARKSSAASKIRGAS